MNKIKICQRFVVKHIGWSLEKANAKRHYNIDRQQHVRKEARTANKRFPSEGGDMQI
jgi:hypothetical protein